MEKPILFSTEMVKAILEGRKTTTRRIVKFDFKTVYTVACMSGKWYENYGDTLPVNLKEWYVKEKAKPPYQVGDILYVRETFANTWTPDGKEGFVYKANGEPPKFPYWGNANQCKDEVWIPSIHMPKDAARIFLKVTDVRVEKIQEITEGGAKTEGCYGVSYNVTDGKENNSSREWFKILWNSLYNNWDENPWVWVIEFERIK